IKNDEPGGPVEKATVPSQETPSQITPTYFPEGGAPSASIPLSNRFNEQTPNLPSKHPTLDPSSIKFYEDALVKLNMPGPDYFEFRQQLMAMTQKMRNKPGTTPELIFQAVVMSFDTQ